MYQEHEDDTTFDIEVRYQMWFKRVLAGFSIIIASCSLFVALLMFFLFKNMPTGIAASAISFFSLIAYILAKRNRLKIGSVLLVFGGQAAVMVSELFYMKTPLFSYTLFSSIPIFLTILILSGMLLGKVATLVLMNVSVVYTLALAFFAAEKIALQKLPTAVVPFIIGGLLIIYFVDYQTWYFRQLILKNQQITRQKDEFQNAMEELRNAKEAAEIAKDEAERANRAKSEFLSNISHELRTPLHGVLSFAKLAQKNLGKKPNERILSYLEKISLTGNTLLALINDLLDLSKLESGKVAYQFTQHNIADVINHLKTELSPLIDEKHLALLINTNTPYSHMVAEFDETRLRQVVRNLLSNAIKFSPEHASIVVYIDFLSVDAQGQTKEFMRVTVSDSGEGLPPDEREAVFDKFYQSSKTATGSGGTGLGLAICKGIVKDHNGLIWADNNEKGGADFTFIIPKVTSQEKVRAEDFLSI